jgi:very-short-patch-repair endonuclease
MGRLDRRIERLAASQHDAVARRQAVELGFSHRMMRYRLEQRAWHRTRFDDVYRIGAHEPHWHHDVWAMWLWGGPDSRVGGRSAAALYGLDRCPPGPLELLLPLHAKHLAPRGVRVRRSRYPVRTRRIDGLPVTDPETTLLSVARGVGADVLDDVLESAFDLGLTTPERLLLAIGDRPGSGPIKTILSGRAPGRARQSRPEGELARLLRRRLGMEVARQVDICTARGRFFLDFAVVELRVAFEVDGFGKLRTKKGKQEFLDRQNALALAGWTLLHFSWDDIMYRPDYVIDCILEAARTTRIG